MFRRKLEGGLSPACRLLEKFHAAEPAERGPLVAAGDEAEVEGALALPTRHRHRRQGEETALSAEGDMVDIEQHAHPLTEELTAPSMM